MDHIQGTLLNILQDHRGTENRVTRSALRAEAIRRLHIPLSDRAMRKALEELRTSTPQGAYICSDTEFGGGYFLARDRRELRAFLDADISRIRNLAQRVRAQERAAGLQESGQLQMPI